MKIDLKTGIIEINGEIIMPGYTFEDFKKTHFYNNLYYLSNIASIGFILEIFKVEINVDISITTKTYIIIL